MTTLIILGLYLLTLIPLALLGRKKAKEKSLKDFYLAGGKLGLIVMFCTLFATQYSGNTFLAFPGKTYRLGYAYIMSITFMMAIITFYMTFVPQLRKIAQEKNFLTPADWISERFQFPALTTLSSFLMAFALSNFLLAQLMAMGHAFSGITDGQVPYSVGVLFLAFIIVLYESMGGMRTVAWTDVLQGGLMILSVIILGGYFIIHRDLYFTSLPDQILSTSPEKIFPPDFKGCLTWLSSIFLVGLGGAMYPQGIQRIYAAKSTSILKKSLAFMVFMPLITVFFAYMMGIFSIAKFPGLSGLATDEVMVKVLSSLSSENILLSLGATILTVGAVAAMMSTADSVLLSLSSICVHDFYGRAFPKTSKESLLKIGKTTSWVIMGILVIIALQPKLTLWKLLEIKFEFLLQVAPPFILGFYLKNLSGKRALIAMMIGCIIALSHFTTGLNKFYGIHWGVLGCLINFLICLFPYSIKKSSITHKSHST